MVVVSCEISLLIEYKVAQDGFNMLKLNKFVDAKYYILSMILTGN